MFFFLETDIREQKKYEKNIQTSVDNTVNDLCCEIKFDLEMFETLFISFKQKYNLFLETYFLRFLRI